MNIKKLNEAFENLMKVEPIKFKLGDADVIVTNSTDDNISVDEIKKVIQDKNPAIFFNDNTATHYIMDFSFDLNGKKYWIESTHIAGDFSTFNFNIYSSANNVNESLNEINDRAVYDVKKARAQRFRDSGYNKEEGRKFKRNDDLYNNRMKVKGASIEDGIDNLVHIGFDKLSAYKPSVVKVVKEIMERACELGLAEPYDFGKGKGKYTTRGSIDDVVKGLLDDKIARSISKKYINKINAKQGLPLRQDESLHEKERSLHDIWKEEMKRQPMVETPAGVIYLQPSDDGKFIQYGTVTNAGMIVDGEVEYDFDFSLDSNLQVVVDEIFEKYGYPLDESIERYLSVEPIEGGFIPNTDIEYNAEIILYEGDKVVDQIMIPLYYDKIKGNKDDYIRGIAKDYFDNITDDIRVQWY